MELKKHNILIVGANFEGLLMASLCELYNMEYTLIAKNEQGIMDNEITILQPRTIGLLTKLDLRKEIESECQKVSEFSFLYYTTVLEKFDFEKKLDTNYKSIYCIQTNKLTEILEDNINNEVHNQKTLVDYKNKDKRIIVTIQNENKKELWDCNFVVWNGGYDQSLFDNHYITTENYDNGYFGTEYMVTADSENKKEEKNEKGTDKSEKVGKKSDKGDSLSKCFTDLSLNIFKKFILTVFPVGEDKFLCKLISKRPFEKHERYLKFALKKNGIIETDISVLEVIKKTQKETNICRKYKNHNFFLTGKLVKDDIDIFYQENNIGSLDVEKLAWMFKISEQGIMKNEKSLGNSVKKNSVSSVVNSNKQLLRIYSKEKKTDISEVEHRNGLIHPLLSDSFFVLLFKEYLSAYYIIQLRVKKAFFDVFIGVGEKYTENFLNNVKFPEIKKILLKQTKENIAIQDIRNFKNGPSYGTRAPSGYLVLHANEPKVYWRRLNDDEKFVIFFFVGIGEKLDKSVEEKMLEIQTKYENLIDCYIINNTYDIAEHDKSNRILGDPGAILHKKYHANSPCIYIIRPDGIILWKSLGFLYEELEKELVLIG